MQLERNEFASTRLGRAPALRWVVSTIAAGSICILVGWTLDVIAPGAREWSPLTLNLGGFGLGALFATFQLIALKDHVGGGRSWILATAVGSQVMLWIVAITLLGTLDGANTYAWTCLALIAGASSLGTAQWFVLGRVFQRAAWWIPCTLVAVTAGFIAGVLAAQRNGLVGIALAMLLYGGMTGLCLSRMRPKRVAA